MRRRCFCGCGRRVRFARRPADRAGRLTRKLELELELDGVLALDDPEQRAFRQEGEGWQASFAAAVHGEMPMEGLNWDGWAAWRDIAVSAIEEERRREAELAEAIRRSGLTPEAFYRAAERDPTLLPESARPA